MRLFNTSVLKAFYAYCQSVIVVVEIFHMIVVRTRLSWVIRSKRLETILSAMVSELPQQGSLLMHYTLHVLAALLLITSLPNSPRSAAREVPAIQSISPQPDASTELLQALQMRLQEAQDIMARARNHQKAILHLQSSNRNRGQVETLAHWQAIENDAQTLVRQIHAQMRWLQTQTDHKATPSEQLAQNPWVDNVLLTRLDGKQENMARYRGEVVFVHFWATGCWPCVQEISALQRLYEQARAQGFILITISLDVRKKDLNAFFHKHDLDFPVYMDPGRTTYRQLVGGLEVLPRSILIDRTGTIVRRYAGAQHVASPATLTDIMALLDEN
jgi:peroxiredoxin